jgi:hypothetical protein
MDTNPTMEASPTTDAKPTPGKLIQFDLNTAAITDLATEFMKLIQFDINTAAITDLATEFIKPEKLTPLLQEHKSPSLSRHLILYYTALTNL